VVNGIAMHANTATSYLMVCNYSPFGIIVFLVRQRSGFIWDGKCRSAEVTWLWDELLQSLVVASLRDPTRTRGTFADGRYPYGSCMMNGWFALLCRERAVFGI
jgi:hypothetical protein